MKLHKVALGGLSLAVVVGAAAFFMLGGDSARIDEPAARDQATTAERPTGDSLVDSAASERGESLDSRADRSAQRGSAVLDVIGTEYRFEPGNPANEAVSQQDADWLHRNGFLDPASYDHLMKASIPELEAAAESDLRVAVMLAYRMAAAGTYGEQPFVILQDAAAKGSVFALLTWGDIHYALPQYRNAAAGNAYYTLAFRRGYFSAAVKKNILSSPLSPKAGLYSDALAEASWLRIAEARSQIGKPPFPTNNLRPGFESFLNYAEASFREDFLQKVEGR
jgi:hypothetical protein